MDKVLSNLVRIEGWNVIVMGRIFAEVSQESSQDGHFYTTVRIAEGSSIGTTGVFTAEGHHEAAKEWAAGLAWEFVEARVSDLFWGYTEYDTNDDCCRLDGDDKSEY